MDEKQQQNPGIERLVSALGWSMKGMRATFKHEQAFRQEVYLLIVLAPLGLWLGNDGVERALLLAPLLIVLIVELLNSAVESVVDRISDEKHKLSGRAKDQGSASVLISLVLVGLCWGLVLMSHI
ncbi:MAG: diacylglycerol kinase [gamma proteobacterium symbiont of Ctena orbiculata]|nr:MAG: diacylglycerol kinase [gamma proteobacterium symbiont of Ctena orbiculata]PVV23960.1 MAG: diacylglycerol kinase [gamma proteobacterium symbiont of Ctena orbiculata]PVV27817.1 MAG: diacylglycerol kinase [gamma proteobacterium symbiont of Ctena orbiculata]